jgi:hypothetical protein
VRTAVCLLTALYAVLCCVVPCRAVFVLCSAVASMDNPIHILSIATGATHSIIQPTDPLIYSLATLRDGRWLAAAHSDARIAVYQIDCSAAAPAAASPSSSSSPALSPSHGHRSRAVQWANPSSGAPASHGQVVRWWQAIRFTGCAFTLTVLPHGRGLVSCAARERYVTVQTTTREERATLTVRRLLFCAVCAVGVQCD